MTQKILEKTRLYCENELREVQTDNLYFGKDKKGNCQGSIYWVEGAETWVYVCNSKNKWGKADDLLYQIDDKILLSYYEDNKEEIDEWILDRKENDDSKN